MSARINKLLADLQVAVREEDGAALLSGGDKTGRLGKLMKDARKDAGMSLQEVAERSGFTKSHIWETEQERAVNPTIGFVAAVSKALGIPFLTMAQAAANTLVKSSRGAQ